MGKNGQNQTQSEHTLQHFCALAFKSAVRYARRLGSGLRGGPTGPTNLRRPVGLPPRFVFKNAPRLSGEDRSATSRCRFLDHCRVRRLTHRTFFVSKSTLAQSISGGVSVGHFVVSFVVGSWTGWFSIEVLSAFILEKKRWPP